MSKNQRSGQGSLNASTGDIYKGSFKNDIRHGTGLCQFKSGALFKGEWRDDKPHGHGILYSGKNEIIECRFEKGAVPNKCKVKIMMADGSYYDGGYENHRRDGQGTCSYPNGELYEGAWEKDKRCGRGKMRFHGGMVYQGRFAED